MALARSSVELLLRAEWALLTPASNFSISSLTPINPVEQIATSEDEIDSKLATCSADLWVSAKPSGPVAAFAPPLFSKTAET